jgi:hypothetical protein
LEHFVGEPMEEIRRYQVLFLLGILWWLPCHQFRPFFTWNGSSWLQAVWKWD